MDITAYSDIQRVTDDVQGGTRSELPLVYRALLLQRYSYYALNIQNIAELSPMWDSLAL